MKATNVCIGDTVHFVTLCGNMRPATVICCNDDDNCTLDITVDTDCEDLMPVHDNEPSHPVCHVKSVKHCPNGTPGTYHLSSEMKS